MPTEIGHGRPTDESQFLAFVGGDGSLRRHNAADVLEWLKEEIGAEAIPGLPGQPGPPGDPGLRWKQNWSSATAYSAKDVVRRGSSLFIAKLSSTNVDPITGTSYWDSFLPDPVGNAVVNSVTHSVVADASATTGIGTDNHVALENWLLAALAFNDVSGDAGVTAKLAPGHYSTSSPIDLFNVAGLNIEGSGRDRTFIHYIGPAGSPILEMKQCSHCRVSNLSLVTHVENTKAALRIATKAAADPAYNFINTGLEMSHVNVYAAGSGSFEYAIAFDNFANAGSLDFNNDFHHLEYVILNHYRVAGLFINGANVHATSMRRTHFLGSGHENAGLGRGKSEYGILCKLGNYFYSKGGFFYSHAKASVRLANQNMIVSINEFNCESERRPLWAETMLGDGSDSGGATGAPQGISITNSRLSLTPDVDGMAFLIRMPGPFTFMNNLVETTTPNNPRIVIHAGCPGAVIHMNNHYRVMQDVALGTNFTATALQPTFSAGSTIFDTANLYTQRDGSVVTFGSVVLGNSTLFTLNGNAVFNGYPILAALAAPADAALANSQAALWFDSSAGAPKVMAKTKDAAGAVASVQLSGAAELTETSLKITDDFMSGGTVSGEVGALGWSFNATGTVLVIASEANHPGILRRTSGTEAGFATLTTLPGTVPNAASWDVKYIVRLNQTADCIFRLGLSFSPTATRPLNGMYYEYDSAVDANWQAVCRNAGTETKTDTTVAVGTGWVELRIRRKDATTISFSVNAGTEIDVATNVTTSDLYVWLMITHNVAVAKSFDIDYFNLSASGLGR